MRSIFGDVVRIYACGLVLLLAACGGSGNGNSGTADEASTEQKVATQVAHVTIDSTLPAEVTKPITKILSPVDAQPVGAALNMSSNPSAGESIVFATDTDGNTLLAAISNGTAIVLSADSTALALARIALLNLPDGVSSDMVNRNLRSAPEYQNLVMKVDEAIRNGTPPQKSPAVIASLGMVISQAISSMNVLQPEAVQASASRMANSASGTAMHLVTTPFPYTMESYLGLKLFIHGDNGVGGVNVANKMPIAWSLSTDTQSGILVEGMDTLALLIKSPAPVTVPGVMDGAYNVRLEQTPLTQTINLKNGAKGVALFALGLASSGGSAIFTPCLDNIVTALIAPSKLALAVTAPNWDTALEYVKSGFAPSNWANIGLVLKECKATASLGSDSLAQWFSTLGKVWTGLGGVNASIVIAQTAAYWNFAGDTFRVCTDKGKVVSCPWTISIAPASQSVLVGKQATFTATMLDPTGALATLPDLQWTSSNSAVASVTGGVVTGIGTGTAVITAFDPVTGASGTASVTVESFKLAITPASAVVNAGSAVLLNASATDMNGNPLTLPNLIWKSSNLAATVNDGLVSTTVNASGYAMITATDPVAGVSATAVVAIVSVSPYAGTYSGSFSGDDAGTWKVTISETGEISGSGNSGALGAFNAGGSCSSDGAIQMTVGNVSTGAVFKGTIDAKGHVSGGWNNSYYQASGTFAGDRIQ